MRFGLARARIQLLGARLATPLGRRRLLGTALYGAWPVLGPLAAAYRRTALRRTRVVCVVGSFGKTTAARAVAAALGLRDPTRFGNARGLVATTLLAVPPGRRHAVLEIGISQAGDMARYPPVLRPDIAVVTGIGTEHNRSLRSREATRHEKAEMVRALGRDGWAVLNGDDPHVRWMAGETRARVLTYGFGDDVDVRASDVVLDWPHGTQLRLHTPAGDRDLHVRLIGRPMLYAVLAAAAVTVAEGRPLDLACRGLAALAPTPSRLQPIRLSGGAYLLEDSYKAPLETIEAALDVLAEIPAARRLVVLGEVAEPVGPVRPIYRQLGARVARLGASRAVFVAGDNGRSAIAGAKAAGMAREALVDAGRSVRQAAAALAADLRAGDVVLLKGRDTQRLERIGLILAGRRVGCELVECDVRLIRCDTCPMLERGWGKRSTCGGQEPGSASGDRLV
jgi:UDP-N-acetylmuramoyl-tripeptide--D-alanyl-D-alanine ligase